MADFRSVQTRMWREDEWFQELATDAKLFFIYLFTNPSAPVAGIYRLPIRTMCSETGLSKNRISTLLDEFSKANKAHYENGIVWVVKMRENQLPGKISAQLKKRLATDIAVIPDCPLKNKYLEHYRYPISSSIYPIDTVSIPRATETETDTDTDTETDTETETETETETDTDVLWSSAVSCFENNIGLLSGAIAPDMQDMWDELKSAGVPGWWEQAITVAVAANKRSWRYVRGVLRHCLDEGRPPAPLARANGHAPPQQKYRVVEDVDEFGHKIMRKEALS